MRFFMIFMALAIFGAGAAGATPQDGNTNVIISDFYEQLGKGDITGVIKINEGNNLLCWRGKGNNYCAYAPSGFNSSAFVKEMHEKGTKVEFIPRPQETVWSIIKGVFLMVAVILILSWFLFGRGSVIGEGSPGDALSKMFKSGARLFSKEGRKITTFADVAGCDEAKEELKEIIDFLKDPEKYKKLGGKIPKGVLLFGRPGTGKTLCAKAVAGEAGVPFFSIAGSNFVQMYVGVGSARVRDLFEDAEKNAPSVIFIDEIDAMGRRRSSGDSQNEERENTLTQILDKMDGFYESDKPIIIIAATNRPEILDEALLRPGRFTRHIPVDSPDIRGREEILKIHVKNVPLAPDVKLSELAKGTPGFVGADLANLVNEAALRAARYSKDKVWADDIEYAKDRVTMGLEKKMLISENERKIIAYHEAGHAVAAKNLANADPVHKVTIISRGMALGATQYLPKEDRRLHTQSYILDQIAALLAGRAAEEMIFGPEERTNGAQNDIERATELAGRMIREWGMSNLGPISYGSSGQGMYPKGGGVSSYSESTAREIDEEIKDIVQRRMDFAKELLEKNKEALERLARTLLEKETLNAEEIEKIVSNA